MVSKLTRDDGSSASGIAQAMGESPYGTRNELLQKHIRAKHGKNVRFDQNTAMELGDFFEDGIIRFAAKKMGLTDVVTVFPEAFTHPFFPVECSLDGTAMANDLTFEDHPEMGIYVPDHEHITINGKGIIECKLTKDYPKDYPEDWRGWIQLKTQVEITGCSWGMLVIFSHAANEIRYFFYQRDPAFSEKLRILTEDWQQRVKTETYFNPETSDDAYVMFEDIPVAEDVLEMDASYTTIIARHENINAEIKELQKEQDVIQTALMEKIANHEKAVCGSYQLDWGYINYKPTPEKVVPAKEARSVRRKQVRIKDRGGEKI
jgi:hypothetical protein